MIIWDKHASPIGIFALAVCVGGGALYQQAPLRKAHAEPSLDIELQRQDKGRSPAPGEATASSPHHRATSGASASPGDAQASRALLAAGDSADEDTV